MNKLIIILTASVLTLASTFAEPPPGTGEMTKDITKIWAGGRGNNSGKYPPPAPLFAPDLSNAEYQPDLWQYADGVLSVSASGKGLSEIWTKETYGNFTLTMEFRCAEATNSGVLLRCGDPADWLNNSVEVQILQGESAEPRHSNGAIFDCLAPRRQTVIKAGEWYRYSITANGKEISVHLNGDEIIKMNLDDWTEAGKNPDGTANKFKKPLKEFPREGRIGFQYHGTPVEFRNIRIDKI